jgi:hypothetical protein
VEPGTGSAPQSIAPPRFHPERSLSPAGSVPAPRVTRTGRKADKRPIAGSLDGLPVRYRGPDVDDGNVLVTSLAPSATALACALPESAAV